MACIVKILSKIARTHFMNQGSNEAKEKLSDQSLQGYTIITSRVLDALSRSDKLKDVLYDLPTKTMIEFSCINLSLLDHAKNDNTFSYGVLLPLCRGLTRLYTDSTSAQFVNLKRVKDHLNKFSDESSCKLSDEEFQLFTSALLHLEGLLEGFDKVIELVRTSLITFTFPSK